MLPPTDQDWRLRLPPTTGPDGPTRESTDDETLGDAVERRRPTASPERHGCPVCGYASADDDDVYAHLMTAHRKSTISAALLRG